MTGRRAVALTALYDDGTETKVDLPSPEGGDVIVLPVRHDRIADPIVLPGDVAYAMQPGEPRSVRYTFRADDGPQLVFSMPTRNGHVVAPVSHGQVLCLADDVDLLRTFALAALDAARARVESGATFIQGAHL